MKVSIVIPCYNEEKWVEKTVMHALAQDYPDFEIILVDNASTDNTWKVLQTLQESHPNKIRAVQEPIQGVLMAREAGRVAATGDIIGCLDADCLPEPDWVSKAVPKFNDPGVAAVAGYYDYYDAPAAERYLLLTGAFLMSPVNYMLQKIWHRALFVGGNIFIRASSLRQAGGYSKTTEFYGDELDTAIKILPYGRIISMINLAVKASSRRYRSVGFFKTQKIYDAVIRSAFQKHVLRIPEQNHPR